MRGALAFLTLLLAALVLTGCGDEQAAAPQPVASRLDLRRLADGRVDLAERDGRVILRGGWAEATFLRTVRGTLHYAVPAHDHAVIALRAVTGAPQFLGENRHFTQGGTDLVEERWDPHDRTLRLVFDVDQGPAEAVPFEYRFGVFVPDGFRLATAAVGAAAVSQTGQVLTITLTPPARQRISLILAFDRQPDSSAGDHESLFLH